LTTENNLVSVVIPANPPTGGGDPVFKDEINKDGRRLNFCKNNLQTFIIFKKINDSF
jgi:hypothetical protein